jgi:hypothetical protein
MFHELVPAAIYKRNVFRNITYDHETHTYDTQGGVHGGPVVFVSIFGTKESEELADDTPQTYVDFIPFDFDSPVLTQAKTDAVAFVRHLEAVYDVIPDSLPLYFSGAKGFHVLLPVSLVTGLEEPLEATPETMRVFSRRLAGDFATFDNKIYDVRRIFRVPGAINAHTGLRKIQLEWRTLRDSDMRRIRSWAATDADAVFPIDPPRRVGYVEQAWLDSASEAARMRSDPAENLNRPGSPTLTSILAPPDEPGSRNVRASRLCHVLLNNIADLTILQWVMKLWNESGSSPLPERELQQLVTRMHKRYRPLPTNKFQRKAT